MRIEKLCNDFITGQDSALSMMLGRDDNDVTYNGCYKILA